MEKMTLLDLLPNEEGRIKQISGGRNVNKRLFELGLNRGAKFKVVKNDIGPVILNLSGNKLALGRGLASKIFIQK
ncbi:FeoA domain-containing protein [Tissierella sp. Yu-01]|uniref:FeoA family protein n=1 Tax=Tissierella sp. Yu-01 TaxID=3035694 RepID=UPI00240DB5E8|nr:FeoA domain-containing protein [Tissierella sp. Yu-01]WFA08400.1 FeoA domain-containing protein [Tissierella sp. Yu-01]